MKKQCSMCKGRKNTSAFRLRSKKDLIHRHGVARFESRCKRCKRKYGRQHYRQNPSYYIEKDLKFRRANRKKAYEFLSTKGCVDCGERDPIVLDFDHMVIENKEKNISDLMNQRSWENVLIEIQKCEVRCANCHRRRTAKQFGYTRYLLQNDTKLP